MNNGPRNWQWDDVRFFLAAARAGSLSAAARMLGVGHVTVGRRLASFEHRLGVTLLSRTPDGFTLTSAGDAILRQCAAMEDAALDLERIAAGRDSLVTGQVRIATTQALGHQLVAPALAELRRTHPGLQVDLAVGVRSLDIARSDADLAIRFARPTAPNLVGRRLGEVGFTLYASEAYLRRTGRPTRGRGLAGHDLITFTGAPTATSPFFLGESLDGARVALRCDDPFVQMKAAAEEAGVAEVACCLGDACPGIARIWPDEAPVRRAVWLVLHEDLRRAARIKAVSGAIADSFRRQRRVLEAGVISKAAPPVAGGD